MSLPTEFKSVIEEEYGDFGWQLANCFSFLAEYLGYKVLDIHSVETALKIVATQMGTSLTEYSAVEDYEEDQGLQEYIEKYYPQVHQAFIRRAKNISKANSLIEEDREEQVIIDFVEYIVPTNITFLLTGINQFFASYLRETLYRDLENLFCRIKELVINKSGN
jgi:hypothetical protein